MNDIEKMHMFLLEQSRVWDREYKEICEYLDFAATTEADYIMAQFELDVLIRKKDLLRELEEKTYKLELKQ